MQTNLPHPLAHSTPWLLELSTTLQSIPSIPYNLTCANIPPLSFLLLADRLAELYEMVFPDHQEWLSGEVVDWADAAAIVKATERFLGRVNRLFPVHDELWDIDPMADVEDVAEVVEWRLYEMPVVPMGFDEWHEEWETFKEPVPYLLHMRYARRDGEGNTYGHDDFESLYADHLTPAYLEPQRLAKTLRQICAEPSGDMALPEPLHGLPDLIEMLDHSTGNAFLDIGELSLMEGGGYPLWNREEVEWLAEEWQKAKPILDSVHRLLNWQNSTPEEIGFKLTTVRDLLLAAYEKEVTNESPATTTPA